MIYVHKLLHVDHVHEIIRCIITCKKCQRLIATSLYQRKQMMSLLINCIARFVLPLYMVIRLGHYEEGWEQRGHTVHRDVEALKLFGFQANYTRRVSKSMRSREL